MSKINSLIWAKHIKSSGKKSTMVAKSPINVKPYIAITYLFIFAILIHLNYKQITIFREFQDGLAPIPEGTLVLASFGLQYKTLYLRPDLRVIPSCEIGFTKTSVSKEYMRYFNEGSPVPISKKTGAKYFLESKDMYVNPQDGRFLKLLGKNNSYNLWKILDSKT